MEYNPFSLKDKTILVTGATSGIGRQTAIECDNMGANVVLTGRSNIKMQELFAEHNFNNAQTFLTDLTDTETIKDFIKECPIFDGAVLCAGTTTTKPIKYASINDFEEIFKINFYSYIELTKQLVKQKKLRKGSSLVFISSIGGITSFNPGKSIYGTSKAALNSFMKFCAVEFAPQRIRVNSICPGMIFTPLIERGEISKEQLDLYSQKYLLKRFGTPTEVAWGTIYFLSDASSWTTGSTLFIDGGGES